ncbi:Fumarate lyase:Delta crystallin [Prochlorococcus marinus str. MIT 9515]|uniref:Argininosuccinate lyase n=1 Tax=Prochlorococcus marinus (strain MIT 9515) TaxID=167542 RepID=ARLY_PROM5|nr:argininosuccinate lyase [Prochlorococcus marinus]A2BTV0.1 RecName: Full=Argininosuccinate lyase; Short=ASAL; AltName: Full=Arginosuccinase [Prochlorococcus marinus str. MIT 9515]ABM71220.1 Fumarate lyase:Delta crystallin [Prochlorococcus marinus str. MIT 9515]
MSKVWSNRFESSLNPFIEEFNASIGFDKTLIFEDIDCSIAHAKMLGKTKVLSADESQKIIEGLENIKQDFIKGEFSPGAPSEDIHYSIEEKLIDLIGDTGKKLHTGRSRNDQVGTDIRLWLRKKIDTIDNLLAELQNSLFAVAESNIYTLIPGYTHMQRAQPLSLAHHFLAYLEMFQRDRERLREVRARVNISPLGAAALAGTKIKIDRYFTASELGFDNIYKNSIDAVSDRDFCIEFASASALIMSHLSRISEEIILWVTDEFSFAKLTDKCATGSSLMPQKKNPDVPELIRGKTGRVYGNLHTLLTLIKGVPLAYNKDFQEDKEPIFDTVDTISSCLKAMRILLDEGIEFNVDKLIDSVNNDFSNATDLADYLVSKQVPFRKAYQIVGDIVKYCLTKNILFKDLNLSEFQTFHDEFKEDIYENLNPMNVVKSRNSVGGTGFEQVEIELNNWKKKLFT